MWRSVAVRCCGLQRGVRARSLNHLPMPIPHSRVLPFCVFYTEVLRKLLFKDGAVLLKVI